MNAIILPDNLPSVGNARLPDVYAHAKTALQECVDLDECQDWADKAEAMASYARQANDEAMRKMADRIQARAIRRCTELLAEQPVGKGGDHQSNGTVGLKTRKQVALNAGLTERQYNTTQAIAKIPDAEFEAAIESENPPTVTALAEQVTKKPLVDLGERKPHEFAEATRLIGLVAHIQRTAESINLDVAVRGLSKDDKLSLLTAIIVAQDRLQQVVVRVRGALNADKHP